MNVLALGRARNYALLALAAIGLLAWAALAVPYFDDGLHGHMILGSAPFYGDPHGVYFPFYKPLTTLLLPLRFVPHPWAFAIAASFHVILVGASGWLTYKVARRYIPDGPAALAGLLTLFALTVHANLFPIRPEATLLVVFLAVVYLCATWRMDGKTRRLFIACVLTGALALPMHTNASVVYIYLILFALWQRRHLTRRDWAIAVGTLAASSLVGLAIILIPHPSHLYEFYSRLIVEESRYTFVIGEVRRLLYLMRPAPLLPITMLFGAAGLAAIALARPFPETIPSFVRRYIGVLIVFLAPFIGLGMLPSGEWSYYLVLYLPALSILAALAYHLRPPLWIALTTAIVMLAVIALQVPVITAIRGGLREWMVVGLVYSAIATPMLCWSWYSGNRRWLAAALILGFAVALGLRYADRVAFDDISHAVRETAQEVGAQQVFATPHFIWVFNRSEYDFVTIPYVSPETPTLNNAVASLSDHSYVNSWLARATESCVIENRRRVGISGFVSNKLRGESDHWTIATITCGESNSGQ